MQKTYKSLFNELLLGAFIFFKHILFVLLLTLIYVNELHRVYSFEQSLIHCTNIKNKLNMIKHYERICFFISHACRGTFVIKFILPLVKKKQ